MSLDAHLLSLRSLFSPDRAAGFTARIALHFGDARFGVEIAGGAIAVDRGEPLAPDATIIADAGVLIDVVHGRRELGDALAAGELAFTGPAALVERFVTLFPLPAPALSAAAPAALSAG